MPDLPAVPLKSVVVRVQQFLHHHLLAFLLGAYTLSILAPGPGLGLRALSLGEVAGVRFTAPFLLLSFLLLSAGLGASLGELRGVFTRPRLLVAGLVGNSVVPMLVLLLVSLALSLWQDPDESQVILVALALVGAMPIAGSSTTWAQNTEGNVSLSLSLVLLSTLLSPLLIPLYLHAAGGLTTGHYAEDLDILAQAGGGAFLVLSVIVPSLLGLLLRWLVGPTRLKPWMPWIKVLTLVDLLVLNYSNAALSLPQVFQFPDYDFLLIILIATGLMCVTGYWVGWNLPRWLGGGRPEQTSMTFAMGMSNNGTGLVLASTFIPHHALVLLPLILFNLLQQIVAGVISREQV